MTDNFSKPLPAISSATVPTASINGLPIDSLIALPNALAPGILAKSYNPSPPSLNALLNTTACPKSVPIAPATLAAPSRGFKP